MPEDPDGIDPPIPTLIQPRAGFLFREGAVLLHPGAELQLGFDTNPNLQKNGDSDFFATLGADLDLRLWLSRNDTIDLDGEIEARRYSRFEVYDRNLGRLGSRFTHVGPFGDLAAEAAWTRTDEPLRPTLQPLLRDTLSSALSVERRWNLWSGSLALSGDLVDFAAPINEVAIYFRDHRQIAATLAVSHQSLMTTRFGAAISGDRRWYDDPDGSSTGLRFTGTVEQTIGERLVCSAAAGWMQRTSPESPTLDASGAVGDALIRWQWEERSHLAAGFRTAIDDAAAQIAFRISEGWLESRYRLGLYMGLVGMVKAGLVENIPDGTKIYDQSARTGLEWAFADGFLFSNYVEYFRQETGGDDQSRMVFTSALTFVY